jgi:hypothetical protein
LAVFCDEKSNQSFSLLLHNHLLIIKIPPETFYKELVATETPYMALKLFRKPPMSRKSTSEREGKPEQKL